MKHAAIESGAATRRVHVGAVVACVALVASCSASGGTRHATAAATSTSSATAATTSTTTATTTTSIPSVTYRVKRGDTLTTIAKQFRVAVSAIVATNQIANPDHLTEGQALKIPPASPLELTITPPAGRTGQAFQLTLTGAVQAETIKFEIDSPTGKYTGGPHIASADGTVTATYQTALNSPDGLYNVIAIGDLGTTVRAGFVVVPPETTSTS